MRLPSNWLNSSSFWNISSSSRITEGHCSVQPINYTVDKKITLQINISESCLDGSLGKGREQHSAGLPTQPNGRPPSQEGWVGSSSGRRISWTLLHKGECMRFSLSIKWGCPEQPQGWLWRISENTDKAPDIFLLTAHLFSCALGSLHSKPASWAPGCKENHEPTWLCIPASPVLPSRLSSAPLETGI